MTNRITPQLVVDAYKATGLTPMRGYYADKAKQCACAIGALVKREYGDIDGGAVNRFEERLRAENGGTYVQWFIRGFDGDDLTSFASRDIDAFADGQAAWQALVDEGLVVEAA